MIKQKILIVTYYWPPAGGSGVQRWLYFVKYLRDFGIEPVVFTLKKPKYPIEDETLVRHIPENIQVIRKGAWQIGGQKNSKISGGFLPKKPSLSQRFKNYIRANYFIPDAKMFWVNPSIRKIKRYIKKNPVDWIISTGPPHSTHLIAQVIHKNCGVQWLADFRDPWTSIDYVHHLPFSKRSLLKHKKLEHSVLVQADIVTVVSQHMKKEFQEDSKQCVVITNGYDDIVFDEEPKLDSFFSITHIGSLNEDRNPEVLWQVLEELVMFHEGFEDDLKINLVGQVSTEINTTIIEHNLDKYTNYIRYIPNHEASKMQFQSQILLLLVNQVPSAKKIVTGKVFEYLRAKRPILAIAPKDGDLANIINQTTSGHVVGFEDKDQLKNVILEYYNQYKASKLEVRSKNVEQYHRRNLTQQLANLLNGE